MQTNRNSTRRSLLVSATALILSIAMLVGTTFAWFTDTASTGVNKIQAGNLDVQLLMYDGTTNDYIDISNDSRKIFGTDSIAQNNNAQTLWEPGKTQVAYLAIKNNGNLALKYKVALDVDNVSKNLYEVMEYAITPDATNTSPVTAWTSGNSVVEGTQVVATDVSLPVGATHKFALSVHMKEEAGNTYQNGEVNFDLTVYATQDTVESDSHDNQYDKNAQYPDVAYVAVSAPTAEDIAAGVNPLANALISASTETGTETGISGEAKDKIAADLAAGTFKLTDKEGTVRDAVKGKEVTLNGAGADKTTYAVKKADASGEAAADYSFDGAKAVVFKNMTVEFGLNTNYQGFVRAGAVRFENCTIKGMGANWGVGDVVFDNCNFVFPEGGNEWTYNLWTYGGSSFTFNNCTFTSDIGKFINVYRQGNDGVVDVTLNGCKFISNAASANKAAVKINGDHAWNVTINNCTTDGVFPTDNSGLWQIEKAVAGNQITVNGVLAYSK